MFFKSLEIENWGGFPGNHSIEFSVDPKKPVTVVHAENGNGKTMLLSAMRYALYGNVPSHVDEKELIDLFSIEKNKDKTKAKVELTILIEEDGQEKEYKVIRELFHGGKTQAPIILENTRAGLINFAGRPSAFIEEKLPGRLADIFFFSGEGLLESIKKGSEIELQNSVETVSGINSASRSAMLLGSFYKKKNDRINKLTTDQSDNIGLKSKISDLEKDIDDLKNLKDSDKLLLDKATKAFKNADDALSKSGVTEIEDANSAINASQKKIDEDEKSLLDAENNLLKLIQQYGHRVLASSIEIPTLKKSKKKEIVAPIQFTPADTREDLIKKLEADAECICGRPLKDDDEFMIHIREWLARDSKSDNLAELLAEVKTHKSENLSNCSQNFIDQKNVIDKLIKNLRSNINQELDKIENEKKIIKKYQKTNAQIASLQKAKNDAEISVNALNHLFSGPKSYDVQIHTKKNELAAQKKKIKTVETKELKKLKIEKNFLKDAIDTLNKEKMNIAKNSKEEIHKHMNELCDKYSKLGYVFEFKKNSYVPQLLNPLLNKEIPLSDGNQAMKTIFFGASLVSITKSYANKISNIIEPGCIAPWVCDAPFSKLDPGNLKACGKVVTDVENQLIIFVRTEAYDTAFKDQLKQRKTLGKQWLIQRTTNKKPPKDVDVEVIIDKKKYVTVKKTNDKFDSSKIIEI